LDSEFSKAFSDQIRAAAADRRALRLRGGNVGEVWLLLLTGFVFMCAGDICFAYFQSLGEEHLDPFVHATFMLAYALVAGGADAVFLSSPFDFQAQGMGFTDLGSVHKVLPGFPFTGYGVNTGWAKSNRNAVVGFIKAVHQGIDWLYDKKNRAEAVDILVKSVGAKPDDVAKTYDLFFGELQAFSRDGTIPADGFNRMLNAVAELGDLPKPVAPMSKFVDDSFLKAARTAR